MEVFSYLRYKCYFCYGGKTKRKTQLCHYIRVVVQFYFSGDIVAVYFLYYHMCGGGVVVVFGVLPEVWWWSGCSIWCITRGVELEWL